MRWPGRDPTAVKSVGRGRGRIAFLAGILGALVTAVSAVSPAAASYGPPSKPSSKVAVAVPLAGSVTSSGTTWATVLMGKSDGDFDLFWELFAISRRTGRLALVTPPGVADNGGLMVAPEGDGSTALVGFGVSQGLEFSPLALSGDSGRSWSPGGLPVALVAAPSAVASGGRGSDLALVAGRSPAVLSRAGSLTSWRTLVTGRALGKTPAGGTCVIGSLEGVAFGTGGAPMVGASCREPDVPGVFLDSDRQWHLADIPVPEDLAHDRFATLRLGEDSALLAAVHGKDTELVAAWEPSASRPWVLSPALRLASTKDLLASGTGPGTTQFVVVRAGGSLRAEVVAGPGAAWKALPPLPKGTATIAFAPSGQLEALSVDTKELHLWQLGSAKVGWTEVQTLDVPIVFGSSA